MESEDPKGRPILQKDLATVESDEEDSSDDDDPSGYIVYRLQIKKVYKTILSEEELID